MTPEIPVPDDVPPATGVTRPAAEPLGRVALASFIGTTIEFYDFYIYGTAAALVLNGEFFPTLSPLNATLASFSTYAVAFVARPVGSVLFGHFGDRIGRKSMLVASLLLMGLSTAAVGIVPGYHSWGIWAPVVLVVLRCLQGIGLGGEWGGAALLAVEHAPRQRRGLYGAFPQLGPSLGFFCATGIFLVLSTSIRDTAFVSWGWRIPFLLSLLLVVVGLVVRLKISETPVFAEAMARRESRPVPIVEVLRRHPRELLLGSGAMVVAYGLFYTATTYCLSYGTSKLGISRNTMLGISLIAVVFLAVGTWFSARGSDALGRRRWVAAGSGVAVIWGLVLFPLMDTRSVVAVAIALGICLLIMGMIYGPMGAYLPELFHTDVRYSASGLAYSLGGVVGGSVAPLLATRLQAAFGASSVGWYVSAMAVLSLVCVLALPETREQSLSAAESS
ncbi:MAG TPA: MFS transporter [Amycolatopsis sp.]|nr:MFS transporter [Amycolatopsis sp.]